MALQPTTARKKRIVIVEDDLALQLILARALRSTQIPLEVLWLTEAERARNYITAANCDLVISDVFLDGPETGVDLWKLVARRFPEMPFLLTSSVSFPDVQGMMGHPARKPMFLSKPFRADAFREAIERILASSLR